MQVVALPEGGHELRRPDDGSTFIREALIAQEEGHKLELSFEPAWADVPEAHSTVTIEITQEENACKVTLTQSNCAAMGIGDNWDRFLASMKSYLETGSGLRIPPPSAS